MKIYTIFFTSLSILFFFTSVSAKNEVKNEIFDDSLGYAYGILIGENLVKQFQKTISDAEFTRGLEEATPAPALVNKAKFHVSVYLQILQKGNTETATPDSICYFMGVLVQQEFQKFIRQTPTPTQLKALLEGFTDVTNKRPLKMNPNHAMILLTERQNVANAAWKESNSAFLLKNMQQPNVQITASGLQYEVLRDSIGTVKPTAKDGVRVHYKGMLIDGQVFDSSYSRNEPIEFSLSQVIKGWTEGLQLMSEGDKFRFTIPYQLAYGEGGNQGIPPFSTLIFEVELLKIRPVIDAGE